MPTAVIDGTPTALISKENMSGLPLQPVME